MRRSGRRIHEVAKPPMTLDEAGKALPELFAKENYDACANLSVQILKIQPHNPGALFYLGRVAELRGNRPEAAGLYREAALAFPHDQTLFDSAARTVPPDQLPQFTAAVHERRARIAAFPKKPALELVNNPAGRMFVPVFPDNDVITVAIRTGAVFDEHIIACAAEFVRPGTTAIDVGANFGQMALQFAKMVGDSGKVVAFEADDYVHHILRSNVEVNGLKNVLTINKAVHDVAGNVVYFPDQDFVRFASYGSYGIDPHAQTGRPVETVTVDSLQFEQPVSFMKVDVQGSDLFAMRGARETISRHRMPIIFEYEEQFQQEFGTTFQDYVDFVSEIGYRFVRTIDSINFLIAAR